jgi:putative membrane protein
MRLNMRRYTLLGGMLLWPFAALAHENAQMVTPSELWHAWSFEPGVMALLFLSAVWFAAGLYRSRGGSATVSRQAAFWSGIFILAVSQISPLHELGSTLFTAHMVQHELLILIAAPLLVYSRPISTFLWAFPMPARVKLGAMARRPRIARSWRTVTAPAAAWTIHAIALWGWHMPWLYQATLGSEWIHALQHISFLGSALLFWWALMRQEYARNYGASVAYIFTTALHSGALGALLTFAPRLFYPIYDGRTVAWGLSTIEDQQLGGLIMWVPSGLVYVALGLWLFARWLKESERRVELGTAAHGATESEARLTTVR